MVLLKENENSKPLPPRLWAKFLKDLDLYIQRAGKPTRLIVLEEIANRAVTNVLTESNNPQRVRQAAMNELRQLFNLEFKLRCDICGTAHYQDEITAPER